MFESSEKYTIINPNNIHNIFIICSIYFENDMWSLKDNKSGSSYQGLDDGCSSLFRRVATDRPEIIASRE